MMDPSLPPEKRYQQVEAEEAQNNRGIFSTIIAGLGVIGLGQYIYKKSLGGNLIADLLHFTGNTLRGKGAEVKNLANKGFGGSGYSAGYRSIEDATIDVRTRGLRLDKLDLVKDVSYSTKVLGVTSGYEQRRMVNELHRESIASRHQKANVVSFFGHREERLTIGEVLDDQDKFQRILGEGQFKTLQAGLDAGLLEKDFILDKRILKTSKGIRDTRLKPLALGLLDNFDILGLGRVAKAALFGADRRFAVLPGATKSDPLGFFVDGSVYKLYRDGSGVLKPTKVANKLLLRDAGDPLQVASKLRQGLARIEDPKGGFLSKLQAATGVGTAYRNRDPLLKNLLVNPFKRLRELETGESVVYRKEYTKGSELGAAIFPEVEAGGVWTATKGPRTEQFNKLGIADRLKVMFGIHDELVVLRKSAHEAYQKIGLPPTNKDLAVPRPTGGIVGTDTFYRSGSKLGVQNYTAIGAPTAVRKAPFYTAPAGPINRALEFANYSLVRLNSLASSSLAGIGFKASGKIWQNTLRLATIPVAYEGIRQGAGYLDYLMESTIGISPIKTVASAYAGARVLQQKIRAAVGIQQTADTLEKDFPGLVDSDASFIGRTIAAPLGVFLKTFKSGGSLKTGGLLAGIVGFLFGGPSPGQPAEQLEQEYAGNRKMPIRRGRFFGGGYQPFSGGDIAYYDYNPLYKVQTDYKTKSVYGSREEYYSKHASVFGIPLPTPSNLFGIRNLFNLYELEEKHYYDRPYSESAKLFDEVPIIGPILSATAGALIKPVKKMHVSDLYGIPTMTASLTDRFMPPSTAKRLGMEDLPISEILLQDASDPLVRIRQQAAIASEPLGIYKWIMQYMGVSLNYHSYGDVAEANVMGSVGRELYDLNVGGAFTETEFARRFLLAERYTAAAQRSLINPLRNSMPTWLPGSTSENTSDRDYFLDYNTGDPYAKLESGEARLPGVGYEALNPLHSETPGVYSAVDRLLVLADVAPYSASYEQYKTQVGDPSKYGDYWGPRIQQAIEQRDAVVNPQARYPRYKPGVNQLNAEIKESGFYQAIRQGWDNISHGILAEIPYFGSKFMPFRSPIEKYEKEQIYGDSFLDWNRPYETIVRPAIYDMARSNPVGAAAKGAFLGALMSKTIPGLGGEMFNPVVAFRQPGVGVGVGATVGAASSIIRSVFTGKSFMPPHKQTEMEAQEYMDRVVYAKARSYEIQAGEMGDKQLASSYKRMAGSTLMGAMDDKGIRSALTSSDRKYFDSFINTPHEDRSELLRRLPTYYAQALNKTWQGDYGTIEEHDQDTLNYFSSHAMMDEDSLLWHPSVPTDVMKIKMIQGGINGVSDNLHRFGFYESQAIEANARFPDVNYMAPRFLNLPNLNSLKHTMLLKLRSLNPFSDPVKTSIRNIHENSFNQTYEINQKIDRSSEVYSYMSDVLR